jgi:hypothetical protein
MGMRGTFHLAAAVGLCMFFGTAQAERVDLIKRGMLVKACTGKTPGDISDCAGYIAGVADLANNPPPGSKQEVCFPEPVKIRVLREAVTTYLESHPGNNDGPASVAVYEALKTLYKC